MLHAPIAHPLAVSQGFQIRNEPRGDYGGTLDKRYRLFMPRAACAKMAFCIQPSRGPLLPLRRSPPRGYRLHTQPTRPQPQRGPFGSASV